MTTIAPGMTCGRTSSSYLVERLDIVTGYAQAKSKSQPLQGDKLLRLALSECENYICTAEFGVKVIQWLGQRGYYEEAPCHRTLEEAEQILTQLKAKQKGLEAMITGFNDGSCEESPVGAATLTQPYLPAHHSGQN